MSHNKTNQHLPKLTEVSLDISKLECKCYVWPVPRTLEIAGLILFSGTYLYGSAGSDDALFIKWRIDEFCQLEQPQKISGLIVDLRDLNYQWGDDLCIYPYDIKMMQKPIRIVVTPERYTAFKGVLAEEELRTDIEVAFAEVIEAIQ